MTRVLAYTGAYALSLSGMFLADYFHGAELSFAVYVSIALPSGIAAMIIREAVYND